MPGAYGDSGGGQHRPPKKKPIKDTVVGRAKPKPTVEISKKGSLKPKLKKTVRMPSATKTDWGNPYTGITEETWKKMTPAERRAVGERGRLKA